jgi:hypothetical protein
VYQRVDHKRLNSTNVYKERLSIPLLLVQFRPLPANPIVHSQRKVPGRFVQIEFIGHFSQRHSLTSRHLI